MRRREFICLIGGAGATWSLAVRAQQAAMPAIGYLDTASASTTAQLTAAFRQGLGATTSCRAWPPIWFNATSLW
jgi:putative ABC transport system substrate-binding protein